MAVSRPSLSDTNARKPTLSPASTARRALHRLHIKHWRVSSQHVWRWYAPRHGALCGRGPVALAAGDRSAIFVGDKGETAQQALDRLTHTAYQALIVDGSYKTTENRIKEHVKGT